jgi:mRNA interferase MazF
MKRGEVWLVNLDPSLGAEIRKIRPAVIINDNEMGVLPLRIILPITDWKESYRLFPWMTKIIPNTNNQLSKISSVDCFQTRSVSTERLIKKLGNLSFQEIKGIENALKIVFGLKQS